METPIFSYYLDSNFKGITIISDTLKHMKRLNAFYLKSLLIIIILFCSCFFLYSKETNRIERPGSLDNILNNTFNSFNGYYSLFHLSAVGLTYAIIETDIDHKVSVYFHDNPKLSYWFYPVAFTGTLMPLFFSGYYYWTGKSDNDYKMIGAGYAVFQANIIALFYTSFLKFCTGRPNPNYKDNRSIREQSHRFRFGLSRGGIVRGWPSGHTAATITTFAALSAYYPDNDWYRYGGYLYSLYTMIGMSAVRISDHQFHWFSDGVAGLLIGYTIGRTVGNYFRDLYNNPSNIDKKSQLNISPIYSLEYKGVELGYHF